MYEKGWCESVPGVLIALCVMVRRSGDAWCLVLPRLGLSRLLPLRLVVEEFVPLWVKCTVRQWRPRCHFLVRGVVVGDVVVVAVVVQRVDEDDEVVVNVAYNQVSPVASWDTWAHAVDTDTSTCVVVHAVVVVVAVRVVDRHPPSAVPLPLLLQSAFPWDYIAATVDTLVEVVGRAYVVGEAVVVVAAAAVVVVAATGKSTVVGI